MGSPLTSVFEDGWGELLPPPQNLLAHPFDEEAVEEQAVFEGVTIMHEPRLRRPQTILTGNFFQLNPRLDHSWLLHNLVPLCVGLCKRDARSDGGERSCFLTCLPRALSFGSGSLWWPTFSFLPFFPPLSSSLQSPFLCSVASFPPLVQLEVPTLGAVPSAA